MPLPRRAGRIGSPVPWGGFSPDTGLTNIPREPPRTISRDRLPVNENRGFAGGTWYDDPRDGVEFQHKIKDSMLLLRVDPAVVQVGAVDVGFHVPIPDARLIIKGAVVFYADAGTRPDLTGWALLSMGAVEKRTVGRGGASEATSTIIFNAAPCGDAISQGLSWEASTHGDELQGLLHHLPTPAPPLVAGDWRLVFAYSPAAYMERGEWAEIRRRCIPWVTKQNARVGAAQGV